MQHIRRIFFPKQTGTLFKGFGPAFLAIAMGIGSGEFILWPYLTAHHGFGLLWGALLGITIQLIIIVAIERHTAFLGEDELTNFVRVWKFAFWWILVSTLIAFGWPGFSAMPAQLLKEGFNLSISHHILSLIILLLASAVLLLGTHIYRRIIFVQKVNMSFLLALTIFLFIYYFDNYFLGEMISGFFGKGNGYFFVPAGISLATLLSAIAYAGSGGNLLLMNSFYVEKEKKGLIAIPHKSEDLLVPNAQKDSVQHAKEFEKHSWKQNTLFFWFSGLVIIILLAYVSYAVFHNSAPQQKDFLFLITEAKVFTNDIHPIVGFLFILSGTMALFGVQLGILDFIGRIAGNKPGIEDGSKEQRKWYRRAVSVMTLFGAIVLLFGFTTPKSLIILGAILNAFSMGIIALLLYRVEKKLLPPYLQSKFFLIFLPLAFLFYVGFFVYVLVEKLVC